MFHAGGPTPEIRPLHNIEFPPLPPGNSITTLSSRNTSDSEPFVHSLVQMIEPTTRVSDSADFDSRARDDLLPNFSMLSASPARKRHCPPTSPPGTHNAGDIGANTEPHLDLRTVQQGTIQCLPLPPDERQFNSGGTRQQRHSPGSVPSNPPLGNPEMVKTMGTLSSQRSNTLTEENPGNRSGILAIREPTRQSTSRSLTSHTPALSIRENVESLQHINI